MKVCVLGSGAMGSSIGGLLADSGSEVYLIDTWAEHIDVMNRQGLKLRVGSSDRMVKVRARTDCQGIGPADLIIVLVKSFNTGEAIENAGPIIGDRTVIMSLQNGLGNEEIIEEVVGKEHVVGGRTFAGGSVLTPGHVIANTAGKPTYIGELDGSASERVTRIAEEFNRAGLLTTVTANIVGIMWDKLLVNVATGALCGITRLPYGGLYRMPELRDCALEAVSEGIAVAKASGVKLSTKDPKEAWFKASEGLPEDFKPSISQSLERGLRTEIDFINGAIVRCGEKCGIPTPVNKTLVASIKGIEYWMKHFAKEA
ncbi:MAG TPA: ketopantoate reductase family protein [Thermodesulfobacteriota bacterium]|nr:ketopantoate reductase family protein [Thermodesulfobacteriota bacterium]